MKMRPLFLTVLALAGLTLAGCGATSSTSTSVSTSTSAAAPAAAPAAPASQTLTGSITDLLKLGESMKCNLAGTDANTISGTAYISGTDARTDFVQSGPKGTTISGHSIYDGTTVYFWTDNNAEPAVKLQLSDLGTSQAQAQASMNASISSAFQNKEQYNCTAWIPDATLFTPPASVNFTDEGALMQQMEAQEQAEIKSQEGSGSMPSKATMCASCASISDPSQAAQCKQALGC